MNIQTEKINLAKLVLELESEALIRQIKDVLALNKSDWWDSISTEEKKSILTGIAQLDKGQSKPHKEVMKKYKKWL